MVEFGEQLRRAREEKGMTQQTLAEKLFVTRQSVSHWECGVRFPDLPTTKKISEILDVSLDDLLSGEDMNEVVERNPVIENKTANNIVIMLYAFIALSFLILLLDRLSHNIIAFSTGTQETGSNYYAAVVEISYEIRSILSMVVFTYGLIHAIKGTLSPKKVGAVIVAFLSLEILQESIHYISLCIQTVDNNYYSRPIGIFSWMGSNVLYLIVVLSAFFFFIRNSKRKVWMILVCAFSALRIFSAIYGHFMIFSIKMHMNTNTYLTQDSSDTYFIVSGLFQIILYGLFMYQTILLYKKRKNAAKSVA